MLKHRVLLLSDHSLLSEGLANLLGKTAGLSLLGPRTIPGFALGDLEAYSPDVVLFAEQETDDPATNAVLFQILQHVPDLPVIRVALSGSHVVQVYTSHTLPAHSADLIETIRKVPLQMPDNTTENDNEF